MKWQVYVTFVGPMHALNFPSGTRYSDVFDDYGEAERARQGLNDAIVRHYGFAGLSSSENGFYQVRPLGYVDSLTKRELLPYSEWRKSRMNGYTVGEVHPA